MARQPTQKTVNNPRMLGGMDILYSNIVPYDVPRYTDGDMWRYVAGKQPVVQACITSMVMYAQALPWDVRTVEAKDNKKRAKDIDNYKKIFREAGGAKRLNHLDLLIQDYYTVPFGGASEAVRYSDDRLFKIVNIDAATLYPTNNPAMPVMQKVGIREPIFYLPNEINRMYHSPRPEISRAGWGMTPTEKVYLAVELLNRGDKYYAQLLLDTPEAGLLDLGDMSKESAEKWLESFKNLVSGIDAFKIPVLYQHTVPAKFIPFGRPPTELMFDAITFKYAELTCAAFGISVGDIGLKHAGGGGSQLSAQLRDEHHSKATGYASLKAHLVEYYNGFLPDDLEFVFIDTDDELLVAKGRARSANSVGMRNLVESGIMTPIEGRNQLVADGLITIPISDEPDDAEFDILNKISGLDDQIDIQQQQVDIQKKQVNLQAKQGMMQTTPGTPTKGNPSTKGKFGGQGGKGLNKQRNLRGGKLENVQGKDNVPASQGGRGEIKSDVELPEPLFEYINGVFQHTENGGLSISRSRRLVKAALKKNFTMVQSASHLEDFDTWKTQYLENLFNLRSDTDLQKMVDDQINSFLEFVKIDKWYAISIDKEKVTKILSDYYADGLAWGASDIQEALYEDGKTNNLEVSTEFKVTNSEIIQNLNRRSEVIETFINNSSEYYISRLSLGAIVEIVPQYLEAIQTSTLDQVLNNYELIDDTAAILIQTFPGVVKIASLVENMIETTLGEGLVDQYKRANVVFLSETDLDFDKSKLDDIKTNYYSGN